ncbi:DNA polymerase III subunit delta' [Salaquimonas pukyongi]|uniref:DNA polymerase III subunit delta' n=1 Tax=Salaquimonas pukyongi TaxID=2712698 RepID=UPI00096B708D|nr:DNA polymerase III subunit delta' [Salaquimonas pukyongi]
MENETPGSWDAMEGVLQPFESPDVMGHDEACFLLARAHAAGRLHHAWLLSGPRGIGKATLAYQFAAHLQRYPDGSNAPQRLEPEDDNTAAMMRRGAHPNLLTASRPWNARDKKFMTRLTVDEVRHVNAFLRSTTAMGGWRAVIVDSADDMNTSAANALLKILEEPPPQTVFFILAHSPRGLLATLRSRCQTLSLKPLEDHILRQVIARQPVMEDVAEDRMDGWIALAGGSARRALELAQGDVAAMVGEFFDLVTDKKPDWSKIHRIGSALAPAARAQDYHLFIDLVFERLAALTREKALNDQVPMDKLAGYCDIWDKVRADHEKAVYWNLDRKQVVLGLYADLRRV